MSNERVSVSSNLIRRPPYINLWLGTVTMYMRNVENSADFAENDKTLLHGD